MKKIKKLEIPDLIVGNVYTNKQQIEIFNKINEIIDYLNQSQKEQEEELKEEDMLRWLRNGGVLKVESEKQENSRQYKAFKNRGELEDFLQEKDRFHSYTENEIWYDVPSEEKQEKWGEILNLDRQLFSLLTDEKIKKFIEDYRYSLSWQEAKRAEAVFNIKEHLYYGIKDIVSQLLSEKAEEAKQEVLRELSYEIDRIKLDKLINENV